MPAAPVVVVTGPPGAGKTTVARLVAKRFEARACVLESDWWWTTIITGRIPPWQREAHDQNRTVVRSFAAAASVMAEGGYPTVVDGIVGPWMLDLLFLEAEARSLVLHYVVLRPTLEVALQRATARAGEERVPGHPALTDSGPIRKMWQEFSELGTFERHVLDTTMLDAEQSADQVWSLLHDGAICLTAEAGG